MEDNKDIQIQVKTIPAFTVLKNGSILKNIFLLRKQSAVDKSSRNQVSDEQILLVGRHPHCHITLGHPSISRHHLRIHSNPSLHRISVVDLSSVHGTWVSGRRIDPGVQVDLKEGDTVKMGGSSRLYEFHWVPVNHTYNVDEQFVPTVCTIKEGEEGSHQVDDQKHDSYSSDNDLEGSGVSLSNETLNPLTSEVEDSNPLKTSNRNDEPLITVSIQAPLVDSEAIPESEISDCINKPEDQLNSLRDNMCNEFDQISHGTTEDDPVSIDHFSATETNEKNDLNQDIERSNEADIENEEDPVSIDHFNTIETNEKNDLNQDIERRNEAGIENENGTENYQKNNGSVAVVLFDGVNRDMGSEFGQIDQIKIINDSASMVLLDGEDMGVKSESVDHEIMKEESVFVIPGVTDLDQVKTLTPDISMNSTYGQNVSASKNLFDSLDGKKLDFYTPDKENKNPNACCGKSLSNKAVNPTFYGEKDIFGISQLLFATDEGMDGEHKVDVLLNCEKLLASSEKENTSRQMIMEGSCSSINNSQTVKKIVNSFQNLAKKRWTMVVDTNSLIDHKSLKYLKLLEGIKGTRLFVPKIVVNELMDIKNQDSYFKRNSKKASLALKWIDECMIYTRWWIHADEEVVRSPTTLPEVLEIAIHLRKEVIDQNIIILSNSLTLKIKAMAEGIRCEAAEEFHESLVNPFSERFIWVGSSARGLTWSCVEDDDDIVRQKYHGSGLNGSHEFKGLKLLARVVN